MSGEGQIAEKEFVNPRFVPGRLTVVNEGAVVLQVTDDGVGFDPDAPTSDRVRPGLGRGMMAERVERLGGVLRTRSKAGSGATVEALVPTQEPAI